MKRFLTCFCAIVCIAPSVCVADATFSRVIPTSNNGQINSDNGRVMTSRVATRVSSTGAETSNANAVRNTVSRVFSGQSENVQIVPSRTNVVSRVASDDVARTNLHETVNTVGRNSRVSNASINANPAVRRAGLVLRPSTAEVGGRATIGDTGVQTGSNIDEAVRKITSRATKNVTAESIAQATAVLEQTATLNKSCQEQYNECMDQFCAVVDANQKRCSCSANLSRYTKVEQAVKDANSQLNAVAQRIRYVGLSADEIRAIMTQTEAEAELSGATDTSETRSMLEEIEDLIKNPTVTTSGYSADISVGLDMDMDFSADSADIFNLDFLSTDTTTSFSNLRGADLYNAAKRRCSTVLSQCKDAGATTNQITGNYDLAIDKDCVAYEQGLTKMNETLLSNVRSANLMLQKARLAVLQNKNQYDAKGCIGALEACMMDDMVCGSDYYKCIDPTKQYIDENGDVILGGNISNVQTQWDDNFSIAAINSEYLKSANTDATTGEAGLVKYLLTKIGTGESLSDGGLCRPVLDKCQNYTYTSNGSYNPYNEIVVNYVQRAMVNIRAAQHKIVSDYASSCVKDVSTCYNKQHSQVNSWASNASASHIQSVMAGACRNVALTCAYAVFANDTTLIDDEDYIEKISNMFYQSMLCPENSEFKDGGCSTPGKCVNDRCECVDDYQAVGGACRISCGVGGARNALGQCVCSAGYQPHNDTCVKVCADGLTLEADGNCGCSEDLVEFLSGNEFICGTQAHKECVESDGKWTEADGGQWQCDK